ncbi:calcium-binding protein CML10 [Pyrus ussuriensis x Pyrus communis]|uniref:Calcium-binding protein CML10 n=1 Tax=Pyrus ussuriensis x Pyrus communis TaxID=2448454 RepID=A0A5N5GGB5_9ROSA|nr:calcium-binding protein CML10 [Pyrus ussuriensis x Pyrus communis]
MGRYDCYKKPARVPRTREQVVDLFNSFDKDGDGMLSKEELKAAFRELGSRWGGFRARRALSHADANHDGLISKEEIKDLVNYALECGYTLN